MNFDVIHITRFNISKQYQSCDKFIGIITLTTGWKYPNPISAKYKSSNDLLFDIWLWLNDSPFRNQELYFCIRCVMWTVWQFRKHKLILIEWVLPMLLRITFIQIRSFIVYRVFWLWRHCGEFGLIEFASVDRRTRPMNGHVADFKKNQASLIKKCHDIKFDVLIW